MIFFLYNYFIILLKAYRVIECLQKGWANPFDHVSTGDTYRFMN